MASEETRWETGTSLDVSEMPETLKEINASYTGVGVDIGFTFPWNTASSTESKIKNDISKVDSIARRCMEQGSTAGRELKNLYDSNLRVSDPTNVATLSSYIQKYRDTLQKLLGVAKLAESVTAIIISKIPANLSSVKANANGLYSYIRRLISKLEEFLVPNDTPEEGLNIFSNQYSVNENTFTGVDIKAIVFVHGTFRELGELSMISISAHREKVPVRTLGHVNPKGYTRGCISQYETIITDAGYKNISDIKIGDNVLSLNINTNELEFKKCTNIFKKGMQDCFSVILADGTKMDLTSTHNVYTTSGWKTVDKLSSDDELLIPLGYAHNNDMEIPDYYIKFLAYAIGNGVFGLYKNGKETVFRLTPGINDTAIVSDIENECTINNLKYKKRFRNNCYNIVITNCEKATDWKSRVYMSFILWTRSLGLYGKLSHSKYIPTQLMNNMSHRQITLFINRLFGTDGYVHIRDKKKHESCRICYTTTSELLAKQIRLLLQKIGIGSIIRFTPVEKLNKGNGKPHNHGVYTIEIKGNYKYKFLTSIGIYGKEDQYRDIIDDLLKYTKYKYSDVKSFLKKYKIRKKKLFSPGIYLDCTFTTFEHLASVFSHSEMNTFVNEYLPIHMKNVEAVKVSNIIPSKMFETYDLEISDNHNLFGNFLTHNSRTIAGTISFAVFNRDALTDLGGVYRREKQEYNQLYPLADQLPPFDVILTFRNEHGATATRTVYGLEIVDDGETYSIDDMMIEKVYQYVARDQDPMLRGTYQGNPAQVSNDAYIQLQVASMNRMMLRQQTISAGEGNDSNFDYSTSGGTTSAELPILTDITLHSPTPQQEYREESRATEAVTRTRQPTSDNPDIDPLLQYQVEQQDRREDIIDRARYGDVDYNQLYARLQACRDRLAVETDNTQRGVIQREITTISTAIQAYNRAAGLQ